jgi:putative ABC transport system permease protein
VSSARQSLVLSWLNLRGVPSRAVSSAVAVLGFAGVTGMLVVLLSGREAIRAMYELAGQDDVVVLMSGTSTWEAGSFIPPELIPELERLPGIVRVEGEPAISKELTSSGSARLAPKGNGKIGRTVSARGVNRAAFRVRRNFHIVKGRAFDSGKHEMIVGRALAEQRDVHVGDQVRFARMEFQVVGIFENPGGTAGMEVWMDKDVYETLWMRPATAGSPPPESFDPASTIWVKVDGAVGRSQLSEALAASQTQKMKSARIRAISEREFFAEQSKNLVERTGKAAIAVGLVMGLGALFGAINTMYAAVGHRAREIATLRALGFQAFPVAVSVIAEALALAFVGALIGVAVAVALIQDMTFAIFNAAAATNTAFHFAPTPEIVIGAVGYVLLLGAFSSVLPCIGALRGPIPARLFAR